jgi:ion channel-forming bestrophin family protein
MIVCDHMPWIRVWPQISRKLGMLFVYDLTISGLYVLAGAEFVSLPTLPVGMMGAALSIFLAFRTKSSYDRWWEARTLWGGLVNSSRTLARQALTLIDTGDRPVEARQMQRRLVVQQIAYIHALRCHLREQNPFPELSSRLEPEMVSFLRTHKNVPAAILLCMGRDLQTAFRVGWLDSYRFTAFDSTLTELTNLQGGCERIKNTPMPRQYDYFPRLLVTVFCLLLPIGLVQGLGLLTPIASTVLSFIFVTIDRIGREIETPFDNTVHDTPMTSLSRTIEINLRQHLGEDTPGDLHPVGGFVY